MLGQVRTTGDVRRFPPAVLADAVAAVEANQHADGGWTWQKAPGNPTALAAASEPDMTGAAMAALCGAGVSASATTIVKAREYLAADFEKATGAFKSEFGNDTDANAWAVDGLKACGIDPQGAEFTGSGTRKPTPLNYLISQQVASGGFRYGTGSSADEYASQDAVRAPGATTTTLASVLNAAVAGTAPAGCVTGFRPSSGAGAITQVNGWPTVPAERWKVSIDGGAKVTAERSTVIGVGDTIDLSYE